MYFTEQNAQKVDAIRKEIAHWWDAGMVNKAEAYVLIADLIGAASRVANTAGTYGCFLSRWQRQSLTRMKLTPGGIRQAAPSATMSAVDVLDVKCNPQDTVYFDPPYTKRHYAAYYHILETIALGDEPLIEGVCGIRPWRDKASDFCYKRRAAKAILSLVSSCPANRVFLSYSTEGHVPLRTLFAALSHVGEVTLYELDHIGRYRPNRAASKAASQVSEVLFGIRKTRQNRLAE